jgi:hypothetical protein
LRKGRPGVWFSRRAADRPSAVSLPNTPSASAGRSSLPGAIGAGDEAGSGSTPAIKCITRAVSPGNTAAPRAPTCAAGVRMISA